MSKREKLAEQSLFGDRSYVRFEARFKAEKKTGAEKFVKTGDAWEDWSNKLGPELSMPVDRAALVLRENVAYVHVTIFDNEREQRLKARVLWIDQAVSRPKGVRVFCAIADRGFGEEQQAVLRGIIAKPGIAGRMLLARSKPRNTRASEREAEAFERWRNEWPQVFGLMITGEPQDGFYVINADTEELLRQTIADIGGNVDRAMDELFGEDD